MELAGRILATDSEAAAAIAEKLSAPSFAIVEPEVGARARQIALTASGAPLARALARGGLRSRRNLPPLSPRSRAQAFGYYEIHTVRLSRMDLPGGSVAANPGAPLADSPGSRRSAVDDVLSEARDARWVQGRSRDRQGGGRVREIRTPPREISI